MIGVRGVETRPCRTTLRASAGFTLLELLVVVVIVGILASIGWGRTTDFLRSRDLANAASSISNLIHSTRQTAQRTRQTVIIKFDAPNGFAEARIDADGDDQYEATDKLHGVVRLPPTLVLHRSGLADDVTYTRYNQRGRIGGSVNGAPQTSNTIHVGRKDIAYVAGQSSQWRSWTFNAVTGITEYYSYGRNNPFP